MVIFILCIQLTASTVSAFDDPDDPYTRYYPGLLPYNTYDPWYYGYEAENALGLLLLTGIFSGIMQLYRLNPPESNRFSDSLGDDVEYLPYPYAAGEKGSMLDVSGFPHGLALQEVSGDVVLINPFDDTKYTSKGTVPLSQYSLRLSTDYGHDILSPVHVPGFLLLFAGSSGFGVKSGWKFFIENAADPGLSHFLMGDIGLVYRFSSLRRFEASAGAGLRALWETFEQGDSEPAVWGANAYFGFNLFPFNPGIISGVLNLGNLGKSFFVQGSLTFGVIWNHVEIFAGLQGAAWDEKNIFGPLAGIRAWF